VRLDFPSGLFPSGFPPKSCIQLSSPPYTLHATPISLSSLWTPEQYWMRSTNH
jgi:hypothetical protein